MEIIIEIGTSQQKELIYNELSLLESIADSLSLSIPITKIIVPVDFDATVNALQNTKNYRSARGNLAVAKNIPQKDGIVLVFSPLLYTEDHDNQTRLQIYLHEFFHVVSRNLFPETSADSQANLIYFRNIYILFDEYYANRKSFELTQKVYKKLSQKYKMSNAIHLKNFIKSIIGDCEYYRKIKQEITIFRFHGNVEVFLKNIDHSFDAAAKAMIYIYSYFHHNSKLNRLEPLMSKSHFFNEHTKSLMEYFKNKYENDDFDLFGARKLIELFMMSFGMKFEDVANNQLYCHVIDI